MTEGEPTDELFLLDTHVWIWAFHGEHERFGDSGARKIEYAARGGRTRLSVISVWEVARLVARQRITIGVPVGEWLARATAAFGRGVNPIDGRIALESTRLPGLTHKDPADRFLIATARTIEARLVTVDDIILDYGQTGHVAVLDART